MRSTLMRAAVGLAAVAVLALAGCSSSGSADTAPSGSSVSDTAAPDTSEAGEPGDSGEAAADELSGTLTVFAAASLKATFDELRGMYQAAHPDVTFPEITYDGSPTLVTQIQEGAPADIFAAADQANMDKLADAVTGRVDFVSNTLRIAVAPGNPKGISSLADLAKGDVITVICAAEVPCGAASHKALGAAGVTLTPASEEENVKAVLAKVASGDADAGLVYATDISSADGTVDGVEFPEAAAAVNIYPIAELKDSQNQAAAAAFIELVMSDAGQAVFAAVGFGKP